MTGGSELNFHKSSVFALFLAFILAAITIAAIASIFDFVVRLKFDVRAWFEVFLGFVIFSAVAFMFFLPLLFVFIGLYSYFLPSSLHMVVGCPIVAFVYVTLISKIDVPANLIYGLAARSGSNSSLIAIWSIAGGLMFALYVIWLSRE